MKLHENCAERQNYKGQQENVVLSGARRCIQNKKNDNVIITDPSRERGSFFRAGARRTGTLWGASEDHIRGGPIELGACRCGNYRSSSNARPRSPPQTLRDK